MILNVNLDDLFIFRLQNQQKYYFVEDISRFVGSNNQENLIDQ